MGINSLLSSIAMLGLLNLVVGALLFAVAEFLPVFCFWRIFEKAGYAPQWSLVAFVPGAQIVLLVVIALLEW